eukprot:5225170-Amphidinium_carterae.1
MCPNAPLEPACDIDVLLGWLRVHNSPHNIELHTPCQLLRGNRHAGQVKNLFKVLAILPWELELRGCDLGTEVLFEVNCGWCSTQSPSQQLELSAISL